MVDTFSPERRSQIMASVRSCNTGPEKVVRSILHSLGFRFRLNVKSLPGCPDIVLVRHKKIVFVHGCFWHAHKNCKRGRVPASNIEFWSNKINSNVKRDKLVKYSLKKLGWKVFEVWECQTENKEKLIKCIGMIMKGA